MLDLVIYSLFLRYTYLFYMHECVFCLYVCLCTTCMPVAWGGQKRASNSWNLNCGWLWTTKWMLGIEPRFSARTSVLNQCAIFPVSIIYIIFTSVLFCLSLQEMFSLYSLSVFYFFIQYILYSVFPPLLLPGPISLSTQLCSLCFFLSVCLPSLKEKKDTKVKFKTNKRLKMLKQNKSNAHICCFLI